MERILPPRSGAPELAEPRPHRPSLGGALEAALRFHHIRPCCAIEACWIARPGTRPSDVQGAAWLDIKRKYMEMRPNWRRLYSVISNLEDFGEVSIKLGFELLPKGQLSLAGVDYHLSVLTSTFFGRRLRPTWLVSSELGVEAPRGRVPRCGGAPGDGRRGTDPAHPAKSSRFCDYLVERTGQPCHSLRATSRTSGAMTPRSGATWWEATIRSVRHKLRDRAVMVETLRGVGYRFAPDRETSKQIAPVSG